MPIIPVLERLSQEKHCKLKVSLGYLVSLRLAQTKQHDQLLTNKQMGIHPWDSEKMISPGSFHVYWVYDFQEISEPFKGFSICKTELALLQQQCGQQPKQSTLIIWKTLTPQKFPKNHHQ